MNVPLMVVALHFVGDFLLQSDWMALNKSKNSYVLTIHVFVVSLVIALFSWKLALATFYIHWGIDYLTSKLTTKLWFLPMEQVTEEIWYAYPEPHKRHWFFVAIGFDQFLHYLSYALILKVIS
jgi:hypothetical protein